MTRDELVAHVWRGVTVGENNLSVQISALRRTLAPHSATPLIACLPGRGYRLLVDVEIVAWPATCPPREPPDGAAPTLQPVGGETTRCVTSPAGPTSPGLDLQPPRHDGRWRHFMLLSVFMVAIPGIFLVGMERDMPRLHLARSHPAADARLSIGVDDFTAIGNDPLASRMASRYYNAILPRLLIFHDLKLYPMSGQQPSGASPHFRLSGSADIIGADIVVTLHLLEEPDRQTVAIEERRTPIAAPNDDHFASAMHLVAAIRPAIFAREHARQAGHPQDALALLIDAHVAAGDTHDPVGLQAAIDLAEQAVAEDPTMDGAKAYLALLLAELLQLQDAHAGDGGGRRAMQLIDDVLQRHNRNQLFVGYRALIYAAMNDADKAGSTVDRALDLDPSFYYLQQLKGEILMQQNRLAEAERLIRASSDYPQDDRLAILAYAKGDYGTALQLFRKVLSDAGSCWDTPFTRLLQASATVRAGRTDEAGGILKLAMAGLPPNFRAISALRQSYYALPDTAWRQFQGDLKVAGMPP
ncbi:winged helix-turn-helix domain-containing protein [Lichenicola sp.]|uniref:winged helix-turn-helix domain-containing protein n=1 Tax=Lichenicola sp. TaxID=2804529 RepID=UPI003B00CFAF